jgi:ABC-type branched-subunit amino acid transport system substrate-binding protein
VKRRKLVAITAAAAAAAVAMSLGIGSAGVAGAKVRHQSTGITDSEITIAGLGPNNPYKQFGADTGAKARFDAENEKGGVNGRTFNYLGWTDDGNSPDTNLQETRRLIQQEGVAALVPVITPWFLEGAEFAEQQKIPAFGWGISRGFCESRFAFGFSGCLTPPPPIKVASNTWGGLIDEYFQSQGEQQGAEGKTAAVLAEDNDSGKSGVKVIAATAEAVDMKVVYEKATLPAAEGGTPVSDFSPYINDIMTSNDGEQPDVVFAVISQNNLIPFAPALDAAGFDGLQTNAVLYSPQAAGIVNGDFVLTQFATPEAAADTPAVQTFVDAIEATAPDEVINQPTIAGYIAADMFIAAVKKAGKNPTPASIQKAAAKMTYGLKGFVGPTKYPKGFKAGTPCGQLAESDGTEWSVATPFQCFTNINVNTLKPIKY